MEEMKVCPFCGKEILAVAKMCKYCREWLPDESTNPNIQKSVENSQEEKSFSTEDCTQDNNQTETYQASGLSSEERNAKIEELNGEFWKLHMDLNRARRKGLDVTAIENRMEEIKPELFKLKREKGLEDGTLVISDDGTIISKKEISIKLPFWERWFYRFF
jgi:ribosomal protein L29